MPTGDQEHQIGEGKPVRHSRGQRMAFEMVDRQKRLARNAGDCLRRHQPDKQAADQAGTGSRGNRIDIIERHVGPAQRFLDQFVQRLDMRTCRNFRHDAAIG
ncbi:hypothetical protein D3C71_1714580 [compost metagenome]